MKHIELKTKVGDYFYVVTKESPGAGVHENSSGYVSVAYREFTEGPYMGVADWEGHIITKDKDIETTHYEFCALVRDRLKPGGLWHGSDHPLREESPLCK